jgi:polyferredoxin
MDKVGSPRGLIRYSTENALAKHYTSREMAAHLLRPRTLLYSSVLLAIILATAWSLAHRVPLKVDVLRDRSTLSREADDGRIENVYRLHISNTDEATHRYTIKVDGLQGIEVVGEQIVELAPASSKTIALAARVEPGVGKKGSNQIFFAVSTEKVPVIAVREKTNFFMP